MSTEPLLSRSHIRPALESLRAGEPVFLLGGAEDPDVHEPTSFAVLAPDAATAEGLTRLARAAGGLVYVCLTAERCDELGLRPSATRDERRWASRLMESIDAAPLAGSGISAADRARTIALAVDPAAPATELRRPGHVLPLRAAAAGTLERAGYTEAAVDLGRLASGMPAAVISEVLTADGRVATEAEIREYSRLHDMPIVTVQEVAHHQIGAAHGLEVQVSSRLPTSFGEFMAVGLTSALTDAPILALIAASESDAVPLVSIHRSCLSGGAFGSLVCDCRARLDRAMRRIADAGGILISLPFSAEHDVRRLVVSAAPTLSDEQVAGLVLAKLGFETVELIDPGSLDSVAAELDITVVERPTTEETND